ncbi:hypothetical protein K469DRAFT_705554 [Zopfia rhizophila CBS 207.26]|uniref:NTF2 domain-containing protein n=1 Tax=Zopfia rhizophila CBS 207.26 TaxID=1314779 RepID=A0A6A6EAZ3_9PEZI|nr:hypothetical protein K469DRAFT_705554 [Zopfia rhizophila CBS 207.26]
MSLSAKYQAFLARPSSGALAEHASLHYITTLTSINEPAAIIKHLSVQEKLLKKKGEKVLSTVESANGLCLDVETTLDFIAGGGAYLPGLDDNFVADRTVTFPMVHIVQFDKDQSISQIRLYWDQGSLLKQIDVIGARARNWPIRDGRDQARLIATSSASVTQPPSGPSSRRSTTSRGPDEVIIAERPISSRSSASNAMGDPHASLSLFQPREINQESAYDRPIAPRAQSAKPPPRDYSELFAGEEEPPSPSPAEKTPSPQKQRILVKSGGGKNFKPNRLFEETEEEKAAATPLSVKTNSKKYNHFEFGDNDDEQATPKVRETARPTTKSKHMSQWDFEDFVTPEKINPKVLGQAVRHFGWSDDEDEKSPVRRPVVHKARPDADTHFEFVDDGTPTGDKHVTSKGRLHNKGLGLYKDHILHSTSDDEGEGAHKADNNRHLGDVTTTIKNENRKKDFGSQWEMTDQSPNPQKTTFSGNENGNAKNVPEGRKKVVKSLDANWGLYEQSPEQSKKENVNTERGIRTSGNGMGGRKGTGRSWAIGGEDDDYAAAGPKANAQPPASKSFWDF